MVSSCPFLAAFHYAWEITVHTPATMEGVLLPVLEFSINGMIQYVFLQTWCLSVCVLF